MEEKRLKTIKLIGAGLLILILVAGSFGVLANNKKITDTISVPTSDPETGLQMWIEAVNARNIDRVYDLAPDVIKEQRPLVLFKEDNLNNTLLQSGYYYINYTLIDKKQNGTSAQIIAQVFLHQPPNKGSPEMDVPINYKFALFYQHDEWKIWTLKWT